ncbi:MAG: hypothetical protein AAF206_11045 [Bacteroidota bacterium]
MEKVFIKFMLICLAGVVNGQLYAQTQIRSEDHFFRRKVVNRIDLREKINRPMVQRSGPLFNQSPSASQGIVATLINGMKAGAYTAYHPDDYRSSMSYEEIMERVRDFDFVGGEEEELEEEEDLPDDGFEFDVIDPDLTDDLGSTTVPGSDEASLSSFETVIHLVEDRIFDKTRSEMVYRYDYIELIWTDPGETLPEKTLAVFRYEDVAQTLDQATWVNRHNEAEHRSLKEIIELRLFNSFLINVSGNGIRTLAEAEQRRQALVEYEHHLWHY